MSDQLAVGLATGRSATPLQLITQQSCGYNSVSSAKSLTDEIFPAFPVQSYQLRTNIYSIWDSKDRI